MKYLLLILALASPVYAVNQMLPSGWQSTGSIAIPVANRAYCVRFVSEHDTTGTKLSGYVITGVSAKQCSWGVYPDGDASTGTVVSGTCASSGAYVSSTGLTINLTAGTIYRLCMCGEDTGLTLMTTMAEQITNYMTPPLNGVGTFIGYSANCTNGILNSTTGALTVDSASSFRIPAAWLEE